jgi:hypothetical protein
MNSTTIITATGRLADLRRPDQITYAAGDISHSLAQINRFSGHCARPYSVAEHSLLVCEIVERHYGVREPRVLLAALLHDAHEAWCGDISTPVKTALGWTWAELESPLHVALLHQYGVLRDAREWGSLIGAADRMALAAERTALLPPSVPWPQLAGVEPPAWVDVRGGERHGWADWRDIFRERLLELCYAVHGDDSAAVACEAEA